MEDHVGRRARRTRQLASPLDQRLVERRVGLGDLRAVLPRASALRHVRTGVGDPFAHVDVDIGGIGRRRRAIARSTRASHALGVRLATRPPTVRCRAQLSVQHALGPAQRDVEEALLLVERLGGLGVRDRHQAALEAGDEHGVELEPLRPVEGEQLDGVVTRGARRRRRGARSAGTRGSRRRCRGRRRPRGTRGRGARRRRCARAAPRTARRRRRR